MRTPTVLTQQINKCHVHLLKDVYISQVCNLIRNTWYAMFCTHLLDLLF